MKNQYTQIAMNAATPSERTTIIENSFKENISIGRHFANVVSDTILNISNSELIGYLKNRTSRRDDAPAGEIKITPSKVTVSLKNEVYEKLNYLARTLKVSKSVILHSLYFAKIDTFKELKSM
jgi:hypothetical protein